MKVQQGNARAKNCELHSCVRCLMRPFRWTGCFPVEGLEQSDPGKMRYTLKSFYTLYYIASFVGHVLTTSFCFLWFVDKSMTLGSLSKLLFYGAALFCTIFSIKLARNWPKLISKALEVEESVREIRTTKNISTKCIVIANALMFLGFVEHILSKMFQVMHLMACLGEKTLNHRVIRMYFKDKNRFIFDYISYDTAIGVLAEIVSLQATFFWNFVDVLIMVLSTYIKSYFSDLNRAINSYRNKDAIPWSRLRLHYSRLVILLQEIDAQLNTFLMMSFFTNLFFLCFQLFNSLHWNSFGTFPCGLAEEDPVKPSTVYLTYYLFSFLYLVLRTFILSILTADVHLVAQGPLIPLYEVPTSAYSMEVQRFQLQLRYTTIGFSGLFFYVTRKTILRVIGTIITYELVLLQFSGNATHLQRPASLENH